MSTAMEPPPNTGPLEVDEDGRMINAMNGRLFRWLQKLVKLVPRIQRFEVELNPSPVPAGSETTETLSLPTITTEDIIFINKPTHDADLDIINPRVEVNGYVKFNFRNHSAGSINPAEENYRVCAIRI